MQEAELKLKDLTHEEREKLALELFEKKKKGISIFKELGIE